MEPCKARAIHYNFFLQLSADDFAADDGVFFAPCTRCDFFHSSLLTIQSRGELSSSKSIFRLNYVPPYGTWTQLYLILAILLPIFTYVSAILHRQFVHSPQKGAENKIAAEHMDIAPFVSMRSASSAELPADTCGKNCNM